MPDSPFLHHLIVNDDQSPVNCKHVRFNNLYVCQLDVLKSFTTGENLYYLTAITIFSQFLRLLGGFNVLIYRSTQLTQDFLLIFFITSIIILHTYESG